MNRTPWVIVLAAGSGSRLRELTTGRDGVAVPKQYCSLRGGRSLLVDALNRARQLTPRRQIVVVVAAEHECWWRQQLDWIESDNIVVQPENRGTAAGVLLPLAHVRARDPAARVVVMPSDHHVERPAVLVATLQRALEDVRREAERLVLLGVTPDSPDTEYGWIAPGERHGGVSAVDAFVEKPDAARATALLHSGALWNSFLFAATASTLWQLGERFVPSTAAAIAELQTCPPAGRPGALARAYATLPATDFSRAVLEAAPQALRLRRVPECGWTDLGTPRRVAECLARIERRLGGQRPRAQWFPTVDLAAALRGLALPMARTA